jgi:CopG family transcriptional regulator, nickel-responsive regulator
MQRVTITLDDGLMKDLDRFMGRRGYENRSEAIRDLARAGLQEASEEYRDGENCVAAVTYVYDHGVRELSKRLVQRFHDRHVLSLATLHVHLDHENCLEVAVLRGRTKDVKDFAEHLIAERNVHYGRVVVVPNRPSDAKDRHDLSAHRNAHLHPHA